MKRRLLFLIASAALFFSCSDIVQNGVETQVSTDGGTYLVVGSASLASVAGRSIEPKENLFNVNNLTELVLKGTREGDEEIVLAGETPIATLTALKGTKIPIQTGNWSFTLSAKLNGVAFSGTAELAIVLGQVNSISFAMQAVKDCGGLNVKLSFAPDENVKKVVIMLKNSSLAKDEDAIDTIDVDSFPTVEDESGAPVSSVEYVRDIDDEEKPLAPGNYYLSFDFYAEGTDKPISSFGYVVNVARGFTTAHAEKVSLNETFTLTYKFADDDDAPASLAPGEVLVEKYSRLSDDVTLPVLKRSGYIFGGWYVKYGIGGDFKEFIESIPTGSTGSKTLFAQWYLPNLFVSATGKSDNDGFTVMSALDSIAHAQSKIESVADASELFDWTIYIDGKVVGTTTLKLENCYAKSLTIEGVNTNEGDEYIDILDGGSVFAETQAEATIKGSVFSVYDYCVPITIKNLMITHGNSSRGYGGAIDNNGATIVLSEGAWITDCHTYYDGGAVMNSAGTLIMESGSRITNNSASDSGGAVRNGGTFIIRGGKISGNSAGGSIIQQDGVALIISGAPVIGENQTIGLASYSPFTPYDLTLDVEISADISQIPLKPGSFENYKDHVILKMSDDSALSQELIDKINLIRPDDGIDWYIDTDGKLSQKAATGSGGTAMDNRVLNIALSSLELHPNSVVKFSAKDADGKAVTEGVTYEAQILYQGMEVNDLAEKTFYVVDSEAGTLSMNMMYQLPKDGTYQLYVTASQAFASSVNKVTSSQTFDVTYSSEVLTPESQVALYTYDTENNAYNYYFVDSGAVATADTTGNADFDNMADNIEFDAYGNSYVFDRGAETVYTTNTAFAQNSVALDPSDDKDISGIAIDIVTNMAYSWGTQEQTFNLYAYPYLTASLSISDYGGQLEYSISPSGFYASDATVNNNMLYVLGYYLDGDGNHSWQIWAYDISSGLDDNATPEYTCNLDSKLPDELSFAKFDEYNYSSPYSDMYAIDGAVYLLARQNTVKESSAWTWNSANGTSTDLYSRGAIVKVSGADSVVVKGLTSNTIAKASITQMYLYLKNGSYSSPIYGTAADDSEYQIAMLGDSSAKENYGTSDGYKFFPNVYALPSVTETSAFAGPARIIAIKPKQLVIADDGYAFYMDANGALCFKNVNRVVTLNLDNIEDLENFVISNVQTTKASFEADISNYIRSGIAIETARSGGTYYDYQNSIHYYDGSNNRIPDTGGVLLDSVQETLYLSVKKDD